jgi:hypothetical protein
VVSERGTVNDDSNHYAAFMASNRPIGSQIAMADGLQGLYVFNLETNAFSGPILDTGGNAVPAITIAFIRGYFLAGQTNVRFSALYNGLSWDPLDTFASDASSGVILADHEELWTFGDRLIRVYQLTTDTDNPWQPAPGGYIQQGCNSPATPARLDNSIFWVGKDPERGANMVWRADGYIPRRVSNHSVEKFLERYPADTNVLAWSYPFVMDGHSFLHLAFPSADASWRLDVSTGLWHEVGRWNTATAKFENHLSRVHTYAWGKHYVGSRETGVGRIYELGDFADDDGTPHRWLRRAPHVQNEEHSTSYGALIIDAEARRTVSDSSDPQLTLRYSRNGGRSYGNERPAYVRRSSRRPEQARFNRIGQADDLILEISSTTPMYVSDAYIEAEADE